MIKLTIEERKLILKIKTIEQHHTDPSVKSLVMMEMTNLWGQEQFVLMINTVLNTF